MQKAKERIILFFDVAVTAHSYGQKLDLPPLPLINFLRRINSWKVAGICPHLGKKTSETIYLSDIKILADESRVNLLINRSDRDASDTVYSDPSVNSSRNFPKIVGEGSDFSAHLIIDLDSVGNRYKAALEVSPGLASGKIARFLNFLLRHCVKSDKAAHEVPHPDGSTNAAGVPTKILAYHKVELIGYPSDEFLDSINGGSLESIELISRKRNNLNWDVEGNTKEISRSVILRVGPKANVPNIGRLREALAVASRSDFGEARVKFKTPAGALSTVKLETESMQIADDVKYVRREKISGLSPVDSSSPTINAEIVGKMTRLL